MCSLRVQPILQENHPFLRQKICLMALMEAVFKRATNKRTMAFQEIAEETKLPLDEVEHLLMKALRSSLLWHAPTPLSDHLQPQAHSRIHGPGRPTRADNMGATARSVAGADQSTGGSLDVVVREAERGRERCEARFSRPICIAMSLPCTLRKRTLSTTLFACDVVRLGSPMPGLNRLCSLRATATYIPARHYGHPRCAKQPA